MTTTIKSAYGKDVRIGHNAWATDEVVLETPGNGDRVVSKSTLLAALRAEGILDGALITDLPEATLDFGLVSAGGYDRGEHVDPAKLLNHAKALLAIHAFIVKRNAEQEAAKKAEAAKAKEAARAKRRDELAREFDNKYAAAYSLLGKPARRAIDRIIELEEAAKVS